MNSKFDLNHQPDELKLTPSTDVGDELLNDLGRIALKNAIVEQDFASLASSPVRSGYVKQHGLYIVEIEGQFHLLDYAAEGYESKPVPLNGSSLVRSIPQPSSLEKSSPPSNANVFRGRKGVLLGAGLGILLTLGATHILTPRTTAEQGQAKLASKSSITPQAVTTTEVVTTEIDSILNLSGTVSAFESTPVMPQIAGLQIIEIMAEQGDFVNQGQALAGLNSSILQAEKAEAEGAVQQAQARLEELKAGSRSEEIARAEFRVANVQSAIAEADSELELVRKRAEANTSLRAEGAISQDSLDEVLNQVRVAESRLAAAKANLREEQQALAQLRAGSRPETIAQAQAQLTQAQGRLQGIETRLENTTIRAPRSGIVASRSARVGQTTDTSEMLFSIIQDGRLELRLLVPETLIGKIKIGQSVQVTANNDPDLKLQGKVREIDPLIDNNSRQATVKVDLPSETNLRPGMFLQAAINTDTNQGLAVPIASLLPQSDNKATAFVVQSDSTVKAQTVALGDILSGERVEILSGLDAGDRLVLKGAVYLKDGDKVTIKQEQISGLK
ncbi:MAG: efflux RND transporter periplasmic adaptor subunit [Cyanobacteria bacterium J06621_8]